MIKMENRRVVNTRFIKKDKGMLFSACLNNKDNVLFHTEEGEVIANGFKFYTVKVEGQYGSVEAVAGVTMKDVHRLTDYILQNNVHPEDVQAVSESLFNYNELDNKIAHMIKCGQAIVLNAEN